MSWRPPATAAARRVAPFHSLSSGLAQYPVGRNTIARTTIFDAVDTGDPTRVKRKLTREPESLDARDGDGLSPVRRALYGGHREIADFLRAHGAQLDVFDAAACGDAEALQRALGRSTKRVNAYSSDGFTPLHLVSYFGGTDAATVLLDRGAQIEARTTNSGLRGLTPLHSAAAGQQTDVALLLLDRGADSNATQPGGWTPLHQAAANGNLVLCKALLKHKAKRAPESDDRYRPLDFAIENKHAEIVRLLKPRR